MCCVSPRGIDSGGSPKPSIFAPRKSHAAIEQENRARMWEVPPAVFKMLRKVLVGVVIHSLSPYDNWHRCTPRWHSSKIDSNWTH